MKKAFSYILILISIICLILSVFWLYSCVHEYQTLSGSPSVSGIDFFLLVPIGCLGFIILSIVGIISSLIVKIINYSKLFSIISIVGLVLFSIEFIASSFLLLK